MSSPLIQRALLWVAVSVGLLPSVLWTAALSASAATSTYSSATSTSTPAPAPGAGVNPASQSPPSPPKVSVDPSAVRSAVRAGIVPPRGSTKASSSQSPGAATAQPPATAPTAAASSTSRNNLQFQGATGAAVITGQPRIYLIFWGSQWGAQGTNAQRYSTFSGDPSGMAPYLQAFFAGLGTDNDQWSAVATQYCELVAYPTQTCPANVPHVAYPYQEVLAGIWADESAAAPAQATSTQIASEAADAAMHFGNVTVTSNRDAEYFVVSPTGTHPDGFNLPGGAFCAWHGAAGNGSFGVTTTFGNVAFTNFPYIPDWGGTCGANAVNAGSAGALDGVSIIASHEYAETLTDEYPSSGWIDTNGAEIGDKCAWVSSGQGAMSDIQLATGTFAFQSLWSNAFGSGQGGCTSTFPVPPASLYNNVGTSPDADPASANLDGNGGSLSMNALASAGAGPGATLSSDGFTFTWPSVTPSAPDNYQAPAPQGGSQTIPVNVPAGSASLGVLGDGVAPTAGTASGTVVLNYSDGSTATATLSLPDWGLDAGHEALPSGTTEAIVTSYYNTAGEQQQSPAYVFATSLPLNATKTLVSLTLPAGVNGGALHIFAFAGAPSANCSASPSGTKLATTGWSASTNTTASANDAPGNAIDGILSTRFSSDEMQAPGYYLRLNLGSVESFSALDMEVPNSASDYARAYSVQVSANASTWTTLATCTGGGASETVSFPPQEAQYVQVMLAASSATSALTMNLRALEMA